MERKRNRLGEYDYSLPGAYFITVCVKEHRCLLSRVVGGDAYIAPYTELTATGKVVQKYLRTIPGIGQYVIMPNHVHMILHISAEETLQGPMWASAPTGCGGFGPMWASAPTDVNVSSLIRSWKTLVTKELGQSIWQRSYYDHVIRDEEDYRIKQRYIEENPARWQKDDYFRES